VPAELSDFRQRLDGANLVVGHHHADEQRAIRHGSLDIRRVTRP